MQIQFFVPGPPVPQPRHRAKVVNGRPLLYCPSNHPVQAYKQAIVLMARQALQDAPGWPISAPMELTITFWMKPAKARLGDKPAVPHTKRPDADNLAKSCLDALSGILYVDDKQVWRLDVRKVMKGSCGTTITVVPHEVG